MLNHLWDPAHGCPDGRHFTGHGFQGCQAKRFQFAGHEHQVGNREFFLDVVELAHEINFLAQAFFVHQPLRVGALRAVSHQQQPRGDLLLYPIKNLDHIAKPLHRTEVRNVYQNALIFIGKLSPAFGRFGIAHIQVTVHKVVDYLNRVADFKLLNSALLQVVGDGCDSVTHFNGVSSDWKVRAVRAHDGNVGPVQRGDKRKLARLVLGRKHLAGQQRADRMRNGVMHVQDVEVIDLRHLRHARGQRQIVRRIFEQRILRNRNFMKQDVRMIAIQPDGLLVGNKMHLMSPGSKFNAQLRPDHPAASAGRIISNANFHTFSFAITNSKTSDSQNPPRRHGGMEKTKSFSREFRE